MRLPRRSYATITRMLLPGMFIVASAACAAHAPPPAAPLAPAAPPAPAATIPPAPPPAPVQPAARGKGAMTPISIMRPLASRGDVRIDDGAGSIRVVAWDKAAVQVTGDQPSAAKAPVVDSSPDRFSLRIRAKVQHCWFIFACSQSLLPVHLTVYVPRAASVTLRSISAGQSVQGVQGSRVDLDSVSGALELLQSDFATARMHSISGTIRVDGRVGRLAADDVSGDVRAPLSDCSQAQVTTISGEINLGCGSVSDLEIKSVSGDATLAVAGLLRGGRIAINTVSGDAHLVVPSDVSARLDLGSVSGSVGGALPANVTVHGHHVTGRFGTGDGSIHAGTVSGDIQLQQRR